MAVTQPVPSWADPIIGNKEAMDQLGIKFNPVWLNWFLTLIADITGGSFINHNTLNNLQGGDAGTSEFYHLTHSEFNLLNAAQTANRVFAGPATGAAAAATFRALVTADLAAKIVTYAKIQDVSATDKLLGRQTAGAGVIEEVTCTAAGRALIAAVDAAAERTALGLGTVATQSYSTGTFTPAITFGGAAVGLTYTTRSGFYTQIGNRVLINATIILSAKGSSTGAISISGLPTASDATANNFQTFATWSNNLTGVSGGIVSLLAPGATAFAVQQTVTGTTATLTDTECTNTTAFVINGEYQI